MNSLRYLLSFVFVGATIAPAFAAPDPNAEIIVNVTVTPEGKKVSPPTREHPTTYVPFFVGWTEQGRIVGGEEPPPRDELLAVLHRELAKQGYVFVPDPKVSPQLFLTVEWGYLNPLTVDFGATSLEEIADNPNLNLNDRDMRALVLGEHYTRSTPMEGEKLMAALQDDRYYIIVTAYDFESARRKEKKPLWRARMSVRRDGVWLKDVMAALITSGAPRFGRETATPTIQTATIARRGQVNIGTPTVVEEAKPAASDRKR